MITFLYDQLIYIQFSVLFRLSATQTIHGLAIATHSWIFPALWRHIWHSCS